MKSVLCSAILLLGVSAAPAVHAQDQIGAADVAGRVDKIFQKWNRTDSPGCAMAAVKDGAIVYKHAYGMADLDHNVTLTPSTVFHVASMSKQFTAAAIVLLAQQGKLSLDDDIHKYIPELADFGSPISIRHLIHHTSGLRDQWDLLGLAGWRYSLDLITDDDVMSVVSRQKELNFKPGEKHVYCNTGYTLMALIVKRVGGMSFREFTTKNIFAPLGMTNTHFRDDHAEIIKNNAYGYQQENPGAPFRLSVTNFDTVGATSLHTTVEDLAKWDENFYHPIVGGQALVDQMLQRGKLNNGEELDYAFGLVHGKHKGLKTIGHGGADAGYRSDMTRFPDQRFSVAVLCNSADTNPSNLAEQVADIYLEKEIQAAALAAKPVAAPSAAASAEVALTEPQLARFVGLYWNRDDDQYVKTYVKEGKLRALAFGHNDFTLKPASETLFHLADLPFGDQVNIRFEPAAKEKTWRIVQSFGDGKPTIFEAVTAFTPNAAELGEYAGAYGSEEIDPIYRIALQDGKLMLLRLKNKPAELTPNVQDVFSSSAGTVRFTRDSKRKVNGFLLSSGRILNFRFTRRAG
jgi:CubicO group peptidase (beta-lactamase class C family)